MKHKEKLTKTQKNSLFQREKSAKKNTITKIQLQLYTIHYAIYILLSYMLYKLHMMFIDVYWRLFPNLQSGNIRRILLQER